MAERIERAAPHEVAVLFRGENGTGKTSLARALHDLGPRRDRPFVEVNCPALTPELLSSELFGHRRGSFTGAVQDQAGKAECAEGGSLFLDEIGELDPGLQARMLRFVEEKSYERIGESRRREANVRVIAATNRDLEQDIREGRFRQDMYFRLSALEIVVPPLRHRVEDIPHLIAHFLSSFGSRLEVSVEALQALQRYSWPGNVRELKGVIERASILARSSVLQVEDLPPRVFEKPGRSPSLGGRHTMEEIEREHIEQVLARCATQEEAAAMLGLAVSTLWRKRRRWEDGA